MPFPLQATPPPPVAEFRAEYRASELGPSYSGWAHLLFTSLTSLLAIAVAAFNVRGASFREWLTVPAMFVLGNFGEYVFHRGPMHHPRPGLRLLYKRHALQHHRYYTHEAMAFESSRDFKMVLFPPLLVVAFLGLFALPVGAALHVVASPNIGWLFVATSVGYFLTYEWLHFTWHLPASSWLGRRGVVQRLRRLHALHHDPRVMTHANFNITIPLMDLLARTYRRQ